MPIERMRQTLPGTLNLDQLRDYEKQGWKAVAVEWEREAPQQARPLTEEPPFGTRVAKDCRTLEEDAEETEVLATMMELIIQDGPYSFIAQELNRRGFLTRRGAKWNPISVFEMLPRLIEAGPKIFSGEEWRRRRQESRQRRQLLPL
jgi:hypothetical protein